MGSKLEVLVFTETNLGTRIAIAVSPDITAGDFKRELEKAHIESFPELGKITSTTMMVKQKSYFYHLPDSLPIRHACQGRKKVWFVRVDVCLLNNLERFCVQRCIALERRASFSHVKDQIEVNKKNAIIKHEKAKLRGIWCLRAVIQGLMVATYATRRKTKRKRRHISKKSPAGDNVGLKPQYVVAHGRSSDAPKGEGDGPKEMIGPVQVWDSSDTAETPYGSLSGAVSVSCIIDRYFSNFVELDQNDSPLSSEFPKRVGTNQLKEQACAENTPSSMLRTTQRSSVHKTTQGFLPSPLPIDASYVGLRKKYERSEVGERLVTASNSLRQCQSKQTTPRSNLSKGKMILKPDIGSVALNLVFEIGDDD